MTTQSVFKQQNVKLYFQAAARIATTEPCDIKGYKQYEEEVKTLET